MFAKIINNTIESYPYNPQLDYPLTSFPDGDSYPAFNCYWVYSTAPVNPDPESYDAIELTPVFNSEIDRWEQGWDFIEKPSSPDWDNFNLTFSTLPSLIQAETIANQNHPSITGKKDDAYAMIDSHGVTAFGYIFPLFCQAGQVSPETREEWAALAESFNMPADFVAIVRGSTP